MWLLHVEKLFCIRSSKVPLKIIFSDSHHCYPFIVYFGLTHFDSTLVMFFVIALLMIRGFTEKQKNTRSVILHQRWCIGRGLFLGRTNRG